MVHLDDEQSQKVITTLVEGLTTDGSYHKQWALEEVFKLVAPEQFKDCKAARKWEDGLVP